MTSRRSRSRPESCQSETCEKPYWKPILRDQEGIPNFCIHLTKPCPSHFSYTPSVSPLPDFPLPLFMSVATRRPGVAPRKILIPPGAVVPFPDPVSYQSPTPEILHLCFLEFFLFFALMDYRNITYIPYYISCRGTTYWLNSSIPYSTLTTASVVTI